MNQATAFLKFRQWQSSGKSWASLDTKTLYLAILHSWNMYAPRRFRQPRIRHYNPPKDEPSIEEFATFYLMLSEVMRRDDLHPEAKAYIRPLALIVEFRDSEQPSQILTGHPDNWTPPDQVEEEVTGNVKKFTGDDDPLSRGIPLAGDLSDYGINFHRSPTPCPMCNGRGYVVAKDGGHNETCPSCGGTGIHPTK